MSPAKKTQPKRPPGRPRAEKRAERMLTLRIGEDDEKRLAALVAERQRELEAGGGGERATTASVLRGMIHRKASGLDPLGAEYERFKRLDARHTRSMNALADALGVLRAVVERDLEPATRRDLTELLAKLERARDEDESATR